MYRLPCAIEYIKSEAAPAYILILSRADLPQFISLVDKLKNGSCKGVELTGKDKQVCHVCLEGGLLAFVMKGVTLQLDEIQAECFGSFLADMTADEPRYDHIDFEFRDVGIDISVRVVR